MFSAKLILIKFTKRIDRTVFFNEWDEVFFYVKTLSSNSKKNISGKPLIPFDDKFG